MKRLITICFLALLVAQGLAQAAVLPVEPGKRPYPTIRSAMNAANGGDIIELAPGVYTGPDNRDIIFTYGVTIKSR